MILDISLQLGSVCGFKSRIQFRAERKCANEVENKNIHYGNVLLSIISFESRRLCVEVFLGQRLYQELDNKKLNNYCLPQLFSQKQSKEFVLR